MTPDLAASAKASDPGTWNKYAYVDGDPVNNLDPTGQWWIQIGDTFINGPVGAPEISWNVCGYYCQVGVGIANAVLLAYQQAQPKVTVDCEVEVIAQRISGLHGSGYHTFTRTTITTTVGNVSTSLIQTFEAVNVPKSNPSSDFCSPRQVITGSCWLNRRTQTGGGSTYAFPGSPNQTLWDSGDSAENCPGVAAIQANFQAYSDDKHQYTGVLPCFTPTTTASHSLC